MTNKKITPAQNKLIVESLCRIDAANLNRIDHFRLALVASIESLNEQTADHQSEEATSDAIMKSAGLPKPKTLEKELADKRHLDIATDPVVIFEGFNKNNEIIFRVYSNGHVDGLPEGTYILNSIPAEFAYSASRIENFHKVLRPRNWAESLFIPWFFARRSFKDFRQK